MDARYYTCEVRLHVECFYHGLCDPLADTERRIRGTADYVEDAARLAVAKTHRSAETPAGIRGKANDPLRMEREQRKLDDTPDILPGLDIIDFVKFLGDPDSYCMHTKQGDITIETIDKINSQAKFRAEVRAATNVIIPKVANRVWVNRRQKILQICKDVGVKDPSHPIPETRSLAPRLHPQQALRPGREGVEEGAPEGVPLPGGREDPNLPHGFRQVAGSEPGQESEPPSAGAKDARGPCKA